GPANAPASTTGGAAGAAPPGSRFDQFGNVVRPTANTSQEAQSAARTATQGGTNNTDVPAHVLAGARHAAMMGPRAVQQWMAANGYPRSGNWCGEFVADVMNEAGGSIPRNPQIASNWRNWGSPTNRPQPGDIAVRRGVQTGALGSHVAVVESVNGDGSINTIGGNQGGRSLRGRIQNPRMYDFRTARGGSAPTTPAPDQVASRGAIVPGTPGYASYERQVGQIESGGNPNVVTGSNHGLYQFGPAEMRKYGITNWRDPGQQRRALARETADNRRLLRNALGREPTAAELYFTHQQGVGGGPALLRAAQNNPNAPAWRVLQRFYRDPRTAIRAIYANVPRNNPLRQTAPSRITAGQFVAMWNDRFNRGYGGDTELAQASGQ
ncbi:MAG TPA: CHAP domain-containing protein, partial [Xanthobacteraceae bacterium]